MIDQVIFNLWGRGRGFLKFFGVTVVRHQDELA